MPKISLFKWCLDNNTLLINEWDVNKNEKLETSEYTFGSNKKVWWVCSICGYNWEASINSRVRGSGCPNCYKKRMGDLRRKEAIERGHSLSEQRPDLVKEWHPKLNINTSPEKIGCGSRSKVWWLCSKCGESWQAAVSNRNNGAGCPFCTGKKPIQGQTDLPSHNPEVMVDWDYEKNNGVDPYFLSFASHKKVFWKCSKCGGCWCSVVKNRTLAGSGCPYCSEDHQKLLQGFNDLMTLKPNIASQWHPTKNGELKPTDVTPGSGLRVWWKCQKCGGEWEVAIYARSVRDSGCPYCNPTKKKVLAGYNDLQHINPDLSSEWHPTKNGKLTPDQVTPNSHRKVWWLGKCGHEWKDVVNHRAYNRGCPICGSELKTSFNEIAIFYYLSKITDVILNYRPSFLNRMELDIFMPKYNVAVEYDGLKWHKNKGDKDQLKNDLCAKNNIHLLRIREKGLPNLPNSYYVSCRDYTYLDLNKAICWVISFLSERFGVNKDISVDVGRDAVEIAAIKYKSKKKNSLAEKFPQLLDEWDYDKNGSLNPEYVYPNSDKKVWWKCRLCGYSWTAALTNRTNNGTGCPVCSGRIVVNGINDISGHYPLLVDLFDSEKNSERSPYNTSYRYQKAIWWKCEKGHEWKARIETLVSHDCLCPYCNPEKYKKKR